MTTFAAFAKRRRFWVLLFGLLGFLIGYFLVTDNSLFWFLHWKYLPPLPNGETARRFDEVRFRDSIDVLTDQGHAWRCRLLVPGNCWIPIPEEKNLINPSTVCESLPHPRVPRGARKSYLACRHHETISEMFLVILRKDGQVAIWDKKVLNPGNEKYISLWFMVLVIQPVIGHDKNFGAWYEVLDEFLPENDVIVGTVFLCPGMIVGLLVDFFVNRRWRRKPKPQEITIHDSSPVT